MPRTPFWNDLEDEVQAVAEGALETLRKAGAELVDIDVPGLFELNASVSFPVALDEFGRDMRAYLQARQR